MLRGGKEIGKESRWMKKGETGNICPELETALLVLPVDMVVPLAKKRILTPTI